MMTVVRVAVKAGVVIGLMASALVVGGARVEAQESQTAGLCDTAGVTQFDDVSVDEYGADYILCMRALGLSTGRADGTYGPDGQLTRAQMASFIVRLWRDVLNQTCPDVETPFTDVAPDSVHAANIGCLYGLGITTGTTATTYEPQAKLTSSQLSRFLLRTYRQVVDTCATAAPGLDEAVAYLQGLRVIPSAAEGTGNAAVTRAQMAVYLIGLWHNIAGHGLPPLPPQRFAEPAPVVLPTVPFSMGDFVGGQWLEYADPKLAASIKELGWVQDGVDDTEVDAIKHLWSMDLDLASFVASLGWVRDGIDDTEVDAIKHLWSIDRVDRDLASFVASLGWVRDGIDDTEVDAIEHLLYIAYSDAGAALRIADMPFVETIEPPDVSALRSLWYLAVVRSEHLERVMSHSALRDGIADELTPVVATLDGVASVNPGLIDVLLDPDKVLLERRVLMLPLSGEVIVDIIRTGSGATRSMELLEHSVRCAEEFMGVPLPTDHVILLFEDAVRTGRGGTNFGTHIAIPPEYDTDNGSSRQAADGIIAHEVAHYYWTGNARWINEGASDFMASISQRAQTGYRVGPTTFPCAYPGNIVELESQRVAEDVVHPCNYSLGERLFVDLYRTLGEARFQQGFSDLYLLSRVNDDPGNSPSTSLAIDHVKEAFRSNDGTEATVIARWYDGTEPYDLGHLDLDPADPRLPSINGRIDDAYIVTDKNGPAVSGFSARDIDDWVYVKLEYSYSIPSDSEVPFRLVQYYADGFSLSDKARILSADARYIRGTWRLSIGVPPTLEWAPGRYWVYVYANGRKVADVEFVVTP